MNEEAAFLKAIKKNPKDRTARLVFADWLQERDDPRAEWVRDDDIWRVMKPDATPPLPRIFKMIKDEGRVPVAALRKLSPGVIPELLKALTKLNGFDAEVLQDAMEDIGPAAEPALPALLDALKSKTKRVRIGAFQCLVGLAPTNPVARQQVIAGLEDKLEEIREIAEDAFRKIGRDADSAPQLTEMVRRSTGMTFVAAIEALQKLGPLDHSLIPDLIRTLVQSQDDYEVSGAAREALASIGLPAVAPLLEAAPSFDEIGLNWDIEYTIDDMKVPRAELYKSLQHTIDTNPSAAVRRLAVTAWQWVEPRTTAASLPWIAEALRNPDESIRDDAWYAIRDLGPRAASLLPRLLEIVGDSTSSWSDQQDAIETIGALGKAAKPALPTLFKLLEWSGLAFAAAKSLTQLGRGPSAVVVLLSQTPKKLRSSSHVGYTLALDKTIGDDVRDVQAVLQKAYNERDARSTLAEPARLAVAEPPDVQAIRAYLADPSRATRLVAVYALWHLGTPDALAGLCAAVEDKDRVVRFTAVRALGRIGKSNEAVAAAIRTAKKDKTKDVRSASSAAQKALKRG